ncbi:MAG: CarD family transcriptional regulator [bacterium]
MCLRVNEKNPTRIDFFGDVVDSIRLFNPTSQLSIKETDSVSLCSNIKNIKSVKSITYKEFIKKYNYKLIYINVNEGVYIISNKESQVYKNKIKINTNPLLEHKPNKETFELEIKTNNNSLRHKKASDDNGEINKKNNVYKYEQISKHLVIKYNNNEKNNHAGNTSEITSTIHNYKWGDYITHEDFGVGVYRGIVTKNSNDYIKTEFNNNSTVLVSVHKIYKICPYIGTPRPELEHYRQQGLVT